MIGVPKKLFEIIEKYINKNYKSLFGGIMTLEKVVEKSYDENVVKSKFKKLRNYFLIGGAATLAMYSCAPAVPSEPEPEPAKPRINMVAFDTYRVPVGDIQMFSTLEATSGENIYLDIKFNGDTVFNGSIDITKSATPFTTDFSYIFDTHLKYSNLEPVRVDVIASLNEDFSHPTVYSTDLTLPIALFGRKEPEIVQKAESIVDELTSNFLDYEFVDTFVYNAGFFINKDNNLFYVEVGNKTLTSSSEKPTDLEVEFYWLSPDEEKPWKWVFFANAKENYETVQNADVLNYEILVYNPMGPFSDKSEGEFLQWLDFPYSGLDSTEQSLYIVAEPPEDIFNSSLSSEFGNAYPNYEYRLAISDDATSGINGFYSMKQFTDINSFSKTAKGEYKFVITRDSDNDFNWFLVSNETGNILTYALKTEYEPITFLFDVILGLHSEDFVPYGKYPGYSSTRRYDDIVSGWWEPIFQGMEPTPENLEEFCPELTNTMKDELDFAISSIEDFFFE